MARPGQADDEDPTGRNLPAQSRRPPSSARGTRTRSALVQAGRRVFERNGFLDARVTDITGEAGVASGSFYTYFTDKNDIFRAVMSEAHEETLHPRLREVADRDDPVTVIEAANRAYLVAYRRNARLMALMEQMALINDEFLELRLERSRVFAARNATAIVKLQERGLADPGLDPLLTAHAIGAMVSRTAYLNFVHGLGYSLEQLVTQLTRLWSNALGIAVDDSPAGA